MRKSALLLAGVACLVIAAGTAHAQSVQSWGDSTTTYFYSPGTTDNYAPGGAPPAAIPPADTQIPIQPDPSFYQAPDSYGVYRTMPGYEGALDYDRPYFRADEGDNLGQGSGHSGYMLGR